MSNVRVRFAPSPTGHLHVGGARTALYNYLFAKKMGGQFVLRIEDTDLARSTEDSLRQQIGDLKWLGLDWDEGPNAETLEDIGPYGPYRQSARQEIYHQHAQDLIRRGLAYYCFMTEAEIDEQKAQFSKSGQPHQVKSPYRDLDPVEAQKKVSKGEEAVIRFKVDTLEDDYVFQDIVRGEVRFASNMVGDFVLMRANQMPVFNFCNAVDDALMKITHVFRAEEHLSNTLRQLMIYKSFDWTPPQFGHLSIILGSDRQKLSKRHGATSCDEYRQRGYLPEALNNFNALLGWSSGTDQEIFSMAELIEAFDIHRLHGSSAVFDEDKLNWVNATHLRKLPSRELWSQLTPFFEQENLVLPGDPDWQSESLDLMKTSMTTLKDAVELYRPLSETELQNEGEALDVLSWDSSRAVIEAWLKGVESVSSGFLSEAQFLGLQDEIKVSCSVKGKHLFMPIRVAIIGKAHGAELKTLVPLMNKALLMSRAKAALERC